jgi:hypothetical protein
MASTYIIHIYYICIYMQSKQSFILSQSNEYRTTGLGVYHLITRIRGIKHFTEDVHVHIYRHTPLNIRIEH